MRGRDDIIDDELFAGTSKSMEGCLAEECYKEAKGEECNVEVVWQDGDSSGIQKVKFTSVVGMWVELITISSKN